MSGARLLDSLTVTGQLTGCMEATSWPLEIYLGAYSVAVMSLQWLLITRKAGVSIEMLSSPAYVLAPKKTTTDWQMRQQRDTLL